MKASFRRCVSLCVPSCTGALLMHTAGQVKVPCYQLKLDDDQTPSQRFTGDRRNSRADFDTGILQASCLCSWTLNCLPVRRISSVRDGVTCEYARRLGIKREHLLWASHLPRLHFTPSPRIALLTEHYWTAVWNDAFSIGDSAVARSGIEYLACPNHPPQFNRINSGQSVGHPNRKADIKY